MWHGVSRTRLESYLKFDFEKRMLKTLEAMWHTEAVISMLTYCKVGFDIVLENNSNSY